MLNRLKRAMTPDTADEGSHRNMQELFASDMAESRRGDIRSKFDSQHIPAAHERPWVRPQGPEGWVDADGVLHPFDHYEEGPESLDANLEEEVVGGS
jgi:hypothetical protein